MVAGTRLGADGMAALAPALGKLVSLTSLNLRCTYAVFRCDRVAHGRRVCVCVCARARASVRLCMCVCVCASVWLCGCTVVVCWHGDVMRAETVYVCVAVADNQLGAEGMAALAPALGNLVSLASLDLSCT